MQQDQQSRPSVGPEVEEKQAYEALLELVDEAKKHLGNLRFEIDPKRPDIPPGIPQALLPVLRRIVQESQAFKTTVRAPIRVKVKEGNNGEAAKKRKRDDANEAARSQARSRQRQIMKDRLDEEGTNLWNKTLQINRVIKTAKEATVNGQDRSRMQMRQEALTQWDKMFADCRHAAYALIQVTGDDRSGNARYIMRNLELATKTSQALYASNNQEEARVIMETAAELENTLSHKLLESSEELSEDHLMRQECSKTIIDYHLARCSLEVDRNNETFAGTLVKKAFDYCNAMPNDIPLRSLQAIARKCHEIGCALLSRIGKDPQKVNVEQDSENALAAVKWFKNGVQLVESKENNPELSKSLAQFKIPMLEGLARASILSADKDKEALDRAQTITDDLLKSANKSEDRDKIQAFLLINLNILRRKKASSQEIAKILEKLIELLNWEDDGNVMRVLVEVEQPPINSKEAIMVYRHFLREALQDIEDRRKAFVPRILLAFVLFLQKQQEPFFTGQELLKALEAIAAVDNFQLEPPQAIATVTIIWKVADKLSQTNGAKSYAAEWFLAGAHSLFRKSVDPRSTDKWRRRAAMCYLQVNDYAKAEEQLWNCDQGDADTVYLQFALASAMGKVDQACAAVKTLGKATSCTDKHLTLAMQVESFSLDITLAKRIVRSRLPPVSDTHRQSAAACGEDAVMKATMRALLAFKSEDPNDSSSDNIALIRALIRMYLKDIGANFVSQQKAISEVLALYKQSLEICRKLEAEGRLAVHTKDAAWLYKTVYNLGIEGVSSWEDTESIVQCFSIAVDLMRIYHKLPGASVDPKLPKQMVLGIHACLCGYAKVFATRAIEDDRQRASLWMKARDKLAELKQTLEEHDGTQTENFHEIRTHAYILEVEILGRLGQWNDIEKLLKHIRPESIPIQVCEAIADLSFQIGVPVNVTHTLQNLALQIAMKLNDNVFSILRWSRSIIELLIHRNHPGDLPSALEHVQTAKKVAEGKRSEVQGCDELEWLLATSWNQGLDLLNLSDTTGQAKAWLETAISFCSLVSDSRERLNHMRKVYDKVLVAK